MLPYSKLHLRIPYPIISVLQYVKGEVKHKNVVISQRDGQKIKTSNVLTAGGV